MEDSGIVALYWARSEVAISETSSKCGRYCFTIANNILSDREDADECVNDTYLAAWNSMPPHRPSILSTFLGKLTRRISIDRFRIRGAAKRGGGEITLVLDELDACIPARDDTERTVELRELARAINGFLSTLQQTERTVFVCRYWFLAPVEEISTRFGFSQSKTKTMLYRTRGKLREYLTKEGLL